MTAARYARPLGQPATRYPAGDPAARRFVAGLLAGSLRHGLPARRSAGPLRALAARHLGGAASWWLSAPARRGPEAGLDALLAAVRRDWPDLQAAGGPEPPEALRAVELRRADRRVVFLLGADGGPPLLVVKSPLAPGGGVQREVDALLTLRATPGVAPRLLLTAPYGAVQTGLAGAPRAPRPSGPRHAARLPWTSAHDGVAFALCRVAAATARRSRPGALADLVEGAERSGLLGSRAQALVRAARRDLAALDRAVLQHGDLSPQNWLADGDRFTGIVDWEAASPAGVPGFDAWHAGVSELEHAVGARRWSPDLVAAAFAAAWDSAPLLLGARRAARDAAAAAGVPGHLHDALETAFHARRLGRRLADPRGDAVSASTAARMLERACAS